MKKTKLLNSIIGLGAIASAIAPIATLSSCAATAAMIDGKSVVLASYVDAI